MDDRRLVAIGLFSTTKLHPAPDGFAGRSVLDAFAYEHDDAAVQVVHLDVDSLRVESYLEKLKKIGKALDELGESSGAIVAIMDPYFNPAAPPPWATPNWPDSWMLRAGLYDYLLLSVRCALGWMRQAEALNITYTVLKSLDRSYRLIPAAHGVLFRSR